MSIPTPKQPAIVTLQYLSAAPILLAYLAAALPVLLPLLLWKVLRQAAR